MYSGYVKKLLIIAGLSMAFVAPGMTLEELKAKVSANFAASGTMQADFVQTRELKLIGSSLIIKGDMALEKDGRLLWNVISPLRYMCIISATELIQWDGDTDKIVSLKTDKLPWLKLLYENLSGWLEMDFAAIERDFKVESVAEYQIKLIPRNELTNSIFSGVEIIFSQDYRNIQKFIMTERNGDVMTVAFEQLRTGLPIAETKWQIPKK